METIACRDSNVSVRVGSSKCTCGGVTLTGITKEFVLVGNVVTFEFDMLENISTGATAFELSPPRLGTANYTKYTVVELGTLPITCIRLHDENTYEECTP